MNAEAVVKLFEEMVDLKVQQLLELRMKPNPDLARMLLEKRAADRQRLEMLRVELVHSLSTPE